MATEAQTKTARAPADDAVAALYGGMYAVAVARADSLQPLQALCLRADDVVPTVMTARYRVRGAPVFGNLLAAFAADLQHLRDDRAADVRGDLLPAYERDSLWSPLVAAEAAPENGDWPRAFIASLQAIPTHQHLLLFCEVEGEPGPPPEWHAALEVLQALPPHVTIVVSDAPRDWQRDPPLPRTTEIVAPEGGDTGQEEGFTFVEAALSGDQPADVDRLGVAPLADGLARLLLLPQTRPLTVGVQAPWGWGKSSFISFVRGALIRHAPSNATAPEVQELERIEAELAGLERSDAPDAEIATVRNAQGERRRQLLEELEQRSHRDVVCVFFNAWRYEGSEQVWAGLARTITASLEGTLSRPARVRSRLAYAIDRRPLQFWAGFVAPVVLALVVAIVAVLAGAADAGDELSGWTGWLEALVPVAAVLFIAWRVFGVLQPVSAQVAGYVQGPDYAAHMGYQHEVIDDLKFLHGRIDGEPRIVVFVDDLDRCGDESIMETLQAINLVLGASDFFVVLAVDPTMIYRAIARQRGLSEDDEAAQAFAENYLRKIIQLPLYLPSRTAGQRFGFVAQLFSPAAQRDFEREQERRNRAQPPARSEPGGGPSPFAFDLAAVVPPGIRVLREVQDTKDELEALHEFQDLLYDNPRELKRLVNVHRLVKILVQRPDSPPTVEHQRKLVAWLVYCARWPGQVDDVLERAAADPDGDHCVAEVADVRLAARDLAPDGTLARAARISLLVRDRPEATRPPLAAASDPAAQPAASPS